MKPLEILPHIMNGYIVLVAEYRGGKVESTGYVDKETGNKITTLQVSYVVERQGPGLIEKVLLRKYLPADTPAEQTEINLVKGNLYAFPLEKFELKRGTIFGRLGAMEPALLDKEEGADAPAAGGRAAPNLVYNQTTPHPHEQE